MDVDTDVDVDVDVDVDIDVGVEVDGDVVVNVVVTVISSSLTIVPEYASGALADACALGRQNDAPGHSDGPFALT